MTILDLRCPRCAALVRPDAEWCTLCHADLRAATEPAAPEAVAVAPVTDAPDLSDEVVLPLVPLDRLGVPLAPAVADDDPPARPATGGKHARRAAPTAVADHDDSLSDIEDEDLLFALLRGESRDPLLGRVHGSLESPGAKAIVIFGGSVALAVALFAVAALLGVVVH